MERANIFFILLSTLFDNSVFTMKIFVCAVKDKRQIEYPTNMLRILLLEVFIKFTFFHSNFGGVVMNSGAYATIRTTT